MNGRATRARTGRGAGPDYLAAGIRSARREIDRLERRVECRATSASTLAARRTVSAIRKLREVLRNLARARATLERLSQRRRRVVTEQIEQILTGVNVLAVEIRVIASAMAEQ